MRRTSPRKILKHKTHKDPPQGYISSNNGLGEKIIQLVDLPACHAGRLRDAALNELLPLLGWAL